MIVKIDDKKYKLKDLLIKYKDHLGKDVTELTVQSRIRASDLRKKLTEDTFIELLKAPKQHQAHNVVHKSAWQKEFDHYREQINLVKQWRPTNVVS